MKLKKFTKEFYSQGQILRLWCESNGTRKILSEYILREDHKFTDKRYSNSTVLCLKDISMGDGAYLNGVNVFIKM